MNAYEQARTVETKGRDRLMPFLIDRYDHVVVTDKGPLARYVQEVLGDVIVNQRGQMWTIEIKIEERHTGNLFLETWSNRNLENRYNQKSLGSTLGWMHTCKADLLFYYFLDTDWLYMIDMFQLRRWAFGTNGRDGRCYSFPEKGQGRYVQKNDTYGRIVPIKALFSEMDPPPRRVTVSQLSLELEPVE